MDFFKSGLKSVLGAPEQGEPPSGAETVIIFLSIKIIISPFALDMVVLKIQLSKHILPSFIIIFLLSVHYVCLESICHS